MSEKQTKKIRKMAKLFYNAQPPNAKIKSVSEIASELTLIHKAKTKK